MAAGVASTTSFMGGIVGITLAAVYLGEDPTLGQFQAIYVIFVVAAILSILIATRIASWPAQARGAANQSG